MKNNSVSVFLQLRCWYYCTFTFSTLQNIFLWKFSSYLVKCLMSQFMMIISKSFFMWIILYFPSRGGHKLPMSSWILEFFQKWLNNEYKQRLAVGAAWFCKLKRLNSKILGPAAGAASWVVRFGWMVSFQKLEPFDEIHLRNHARLPF